MSAAVIFCPKCREQIFGWSTGKATANWREHVLAGHPKVERSCR